MVIHKDNKFQTLMESEGNYPVYRGTQCDTNISRFNSRHFLTKTLFFTKIQFSYNMKYKHSASETGVIKPKCVCVSYPTHASNVPYPTHLSFTSVPFHNWIRTFKSRWC